MKPIASHLRPLGIFRVLLTAALLATPVLCPAAAAPAPAPAGEPKGAQPTATKPHVLAPTEKINVSVEGEDELRKLAILDEKGEVDLLYIRKIKLGGLTMDQAARAIEKSYRDGLFLRNPKVSLSLEFQVTHTVNVFGQVKSPGRIPLPPDQAVDIMDVIILAGGFNDLAKESAVKVTRVLEDGSGSKTWDDIDVGAMIKGRKDRKDALVIQPGDIINVPMRLF